MVTKEDVEKAKDAEATAYADAWRTRYATAQASAEAAAWAVKATAAYATAEAAYAAAEAALAKYTKLKEEFEENENGN